MSIYLKNQNLQKGKYPHTTTFEIYNKKKQLKPLHDSSLKIYKKQNTPLPPIFNLQLGVTTQTTPNGKKIKMIENCLNCLKLSKYSVKNRKSTKSKTPPYHPIKNLQLGVITEPTP